MKKKDITSDPKNYMTTLQAKAKLPVGTDMSMLQKYRMRGSKKTYYLKEDVERLSRENGRNEVAAQPQPEELPELTLIAYVDGSYNKKTGIYGSAALIVSDNEVLAKKTSNGKKMNSMWNVAGEIAAAALGVKLAEEFMPDHLIIRYDCEAVEKWPTGAWQAKNEHARAYVEFMKRNRSFDISYEHVKAHTGDKYNELADDLAVEAAGLKTMSENVPEYTGSDPKSDRTQLNIKYGVLASCLDGIEAFYSKDKHTFKDYAALKVGNGDDFSRMWEENDFKGILTDTAMAYIRKCLTSKQNRLNAMRWAGRGLNADDAVRKVQVDNEIYGR